MDRNSDRFERFESFVIESVAPRLAFGKGPRSKPSPQELQNEAQAELDAQIGMGRPAPDESVSPWETPAPTRSPDEQAGVWRRELGLPPADGLAPVLPFTTRG